MGVAKRCGSRATNAHASVKFDISNLLKVKPQYVLSCVCLFLSRLAWPDIILEQSER